MATEIMILMTRLLDERDKRRDGNTQNSNLNGGTSNIQSAGSQGFGVDPNIVNTNGVSQ
jgi:hypothetical protein